MKSKLFLAVTLALVGLLVGCKKSDPVVGTWKMELDKSIASKIPPGQAPDITMEFKDGGAFTGSMKMGTSSHTAEGTYKVEGKTLTMTTTTEDGKASSSGKTETMTLADDMKSFDLPNSNGMGKMVKQ